MESDTSSDVFEENNIDLFKLKSNLTKLSEQANGKVVDIIMRYEPYLISDPDEISINLAQLKRTTVKAIYWFIQTYFEKQINGFKG